MDTTFIEIKLKGYFNFLLVFISSFDIAEALEIIDWCVCLKSWYLVVCL